MHFNFEIYYIFFTKLQTFQTQKFLRLWHIKDFLEEGAIGRIRVRMGGRGLTGEQEQHGSIICVLQTHFSSLILSLSGETRISVGMARLAERVRCVSCRTW